MHSEHHCEEHMSDICLSARRSSSLRKSLLISLISVVLLLATSYERACDAPATEVQRSRKQTFHAAHGQDRWILEFIAERSDNESTMNPPTFVEAGSFDGLTGSNVASLELNFGWRGLCYEPNPAKFKSVVESRQSCIRFNSVLCDPKETTGGQSVKYVQMASPYEQESGIIDFMDDYKKKLVKGYAIEAEFELRCRSLSNDIKEYMNGHITILSLDVEGSELKVLKTIKWDFVEIETIFVERSHEAAVRDYLKGNDYAHVATVGHDNVFFNRNTRHYDGYVDACRCILEGECQYAAVYPSAGWLNCEPAIIHA